jgi:hypothetical protein
VRAVTSPLHRLSIFTPPQWRPTVGASLVALLAAILMRSLEFTRSAGVPVRLVPIDLSRLPVPQAERPPGRLGPLSTLPPQVIPLPQPPQQGDKGCCTASSPPIEPLPIVAATEAGIGSAANTGASDTLGQR